jgi:hypothetical protein
MSTVAPRLSDEELGKLLALVKQSDSVELKLTVPESDQLSAIRALEMDALDAQIRQVFFFDTPELALDEHGLVVRARRIQGKGDDSVVKLRPVVPSELPAELRKLPDFRVEVDALPGGYVCSGTLKHALGIGAVKSYRAGDRPLKKLFSKEQRAFYAEHAPDGVALDDLKELGPIFVLKLRFTALAIQRRIVAELWFYPDGSRVLELSTRTQPGEMFDAAVELRAFLSERGIDLSGKQETKTRRALEYFAGHE